MSTADGARLQVTVAWSPGPRKVVERRVELPAGATVHEAVQASGVRREYPELAAQPLALCVWGRAAQPEQVLRQDDRVELLRALRVDPKQARRERFQRQGARTAGLFARRKQPPDAP